MTNLATEQSTTCQSCQHRVSSEAKFCSACGVKLENALSPQVLVGQTIDDRYRIDSHIEVSDSSQIYAATHVRLRKPVIVKVLHPNLAENELALERFRREATSVAAVNSARLVQIHDFGRMEDGRLYLAMERLEGETLRARLNRQKTISEDETKLIVQQVLEGLVDAHEVGLVHRDICPDNLFISEGKSGLQTKIMNFGLAKLIESKTGAASTQLGMTFGKPEYMSPEQARGGTLNQTTDIYSLGCVAYECLTGRPPFVGTELFDVIKKHVAETPQQVRQVAPATSQDFSDLINVMLAKTPSGRPQSSEVSLKILKQHGSNRDAPPQAQARVESTNPSKAAPNVTPVAIPYAPLSKTESQAWYADGNNLENGSKDSWQGDSLFDYNPKKKRHSKRLVAAVAILALTAIAIALIASRGGKNETKTPDADTLAVNAETKDKPTDEKASSSAESLTSQKKKKAKRRRKKSTRSKTNKDVSAVAATDDDTSSQKANALVGLGNAGIRSGSLGEASEHFKEALKLKPGNADALLGQAEIALARGSNNKSISLANQSLKRRKSAKAYTILGEAQLGLGKKEAARQSFTKALAIRSSYSRAKKGLAKAGGAVSILEPAATESTGTITIEPALQPTEPAPMEPEPMEPEPEPAPVTKEEKAQQDVDDFLKGLTPSDG